MAHRTTVRIDWSEERRPNRAIGQIDFELCNAFEAFRPLVDDRVREMARQGYEVLNQPAKAELLELLTQPMQLGEQKGPLMVMLHRLVASLVRCYAGESKRLEIPVPLVACSPIPEP